MTREDSIQIELVRIICITSMMWVHVAPGLAHPSYINGGTGDFVGLFLGESMGRISVTTLSFVSGYLFWQSGAEKSFGDVCRRLFFAIFMPMLVWSALFLFLIAGKAAIFGQQSSALERIAPGFLGFVNAWTGLGGMTANESLFFIRDLVVATVIVRLGAPLIRRMPWVVLALAAGLLFVPHLGAVIFRPKILSFVLAGAVVASRGVGFAQLSAPRFSMTLGFAMILVAIALAWLGTGQDGLASATHDSSRRIGIGLMVLALTRAIVACPRLQSFARHGRHSFLAYLAHVPVIGILWTGWSALVGGPADASYLPFFLLAPPLSFLLAACAGQWLDRAPQTLQIFLRGRAFAVGESRIAGG